MQKYRERVKGYSEEVQSWLIKMYKEYKTYTDTILINFIKRDQLFKIYSTEEEFNRLSYKCYSEISKKYKFDIKGLYSRCSYMPFMKNRKRDLELLIFLLYDEDISTIPKDYKKRYLESMQVNVDEVK